MNLSVIPSNDPVTHEGQPRPIILSAALPSNPSVDMEVVKPVPVRVPAAESTSANLSTITEESENYRSSQSTTASSGSSRYASHTHTHFKAGLLSVKTVLE